MRVSSIGNKIRTAAMALAMMHTAAPAKNVAEKVGTNSNLLNKAATEIKMVTNSISEAKTSVKWKDVEAQYLAQNVTQKTTVKTQPQTKPATAAAAKPKLTWKDALMKATSAAQTPKGAAFLGELGDYRIFKIPKDSMKVFYSDLADLSNYDVTIKFAIPKNNKNISLDDCIFQARLKPWETVTKWGDTVKTQRTNYIKGTGPVFIVDSTETIGPKSKETFYSYTRSKTNSDKTNIGMINYNVIIPHEGVNKFGVYDNEGKLNYLSTVNYPSAKEYTAILEDYYGKLHELIKPYQPLIGESGFGDPIPLVKGKAALALSNIYNLPSGVEYIGEDKLYKSFSITKDALYKYNPLVDTAEFKKSVIYSPKPNSGLASKDIIVVTEQKAEEIFDLEMNNPIASCKTYTKEGYPATMIVEAKGYSEDGSKITIQSITRGFLEDPDNSCIIAKVSVPPKLDEIMYSTSSAPKFKYIKQVSGEDELIISAEEYKKYYYDFIFPYKNVIK